MSLCAKESDCDKDIKALRKSIDGRKSEIGKILQQLEMIYKIIADHDKRVEKLENQLTVVEKQNVLLIDVQHRVNEINTCLFYINNLLSQEEEEEHAMIGPPTKKDAENESCTCNPKSWCFGCIKAGVE
jgi:archaellum component FlaC